MSELFPRDVHLKELDMGGATAFSAVLRLRTLLINLDPSLIHLHSSIAGGVGRLASLGLDVPVVYTPHCYRFTRRDVGVTGRVVAWWLEWFLVRLRATVRVVGSQHEYCESMALSKTSPVALIRNPVQLGSICETGECRMADHTCITVGRLTKVKAPDRFLQIASSLAKLHPDVEFIWVGDGEARHEFLRQADSLGVRVKLTGWLPRKEVLRLVERCCVYLQTSLSEGLPLSVLEAMGVGVPVILSDIDAHRELVTHGVDGFIAKTDEDFVTFAKILLSDPSLRVAVGEKARQKIEEVYSLDRFKESIRAVYNQILHAGSRESEYMK